MDATFTLGLLAQSTKTAAQGPDLTRYLLVCVLLLLALGLAAQIQFFKEKSIGMQLDELSLHRGSASFT